MILIENSSKNILQKSIYKNRNFIDKKGVIHNLYIGDQTVQTICRTWEELTELVSNLREKGKKVYIISDATKLGKINLSVRKIGLQIVQQLSYDKAAIVGSNLLYEQLVKAIILASGRGFKIHYFTSESEALNWLLSSAHP